MSRTLKDRTVPDPSFAKLNPNSFKKDGIYALCIGVMAFLGWTITGYIFMFFINQPFTATGSGELIFEPSSHDLVQIQGQDMTAEISSYYDFSLVKDSKIISANKTHLARVARGLNNLDEYYVISGPFEPGTYQITTSNYLMTQGGIQFVLTGTSGISAIMTRSLYDLNFGLEYSGSLQYMGALVGAFIGFVIAVIILSNLPVQRRK